MPVSRYLRLAAVGLLVAACGASVPSTSGSPPASAAPAAEPTAEPAASIMPSASVEAAATRSPAVATPTSTTTPAATAAPTEKPVATSAPTRVPTPKPTPKPVVLAIEAREFLFSPDALTGPAGSPFRIAFTNSDAASHNVTIAQGATVHFNGKLIVGVATITYAIPALPAGAYRIGCIVHPAMTGALTIR